MKRDDQTGLALGGNKTRKLEYLLADALNRHCDTLVTAGAEQSNHCRQTAAAAAAYGLQCHLVLGGSAPEHATGNYLLDQLFGAHFHWAGHHRKGETIPEIVKDLRKSGRHPYVIPYGGSNEIGASGFVEATSEVTRQFRTLNLAMTHIVFASSSGGTHAGMTVGKQWVNADFNIVGIDIDKDESSDSPFEERIAHLSNATARYWGMDATFTQADVTLQRDYLGNGYGVVGNLERRAIALTAQTEGILLDPVYTGRAMGALIDMIKQGQFTTKDTVLFWHTGGTPGLFAYTKGVL